MQGVHLAPHIYVRTGHPPGALALRRSAPPLVYNIQICDANIEIVTQQLHCTHNKVTPYETYVDTQTVTTAIQKPTA